MNKFTDEGYNFYERGERGDRPPFSKYSIFHIVLWWGMYINVMHQYSWKSDHKRIFLNFYEEGNGEINKSIFIKIEL